MLQKTLAEFKATRAADIAAGPSFEVLADGEYIGTFVVAIPDGGFDPRYKIGNIASQFDQTRGIGIEWKPDPVVEDRHAKKEAPVAAAAEVVEDDDIEQVQEDSAIVGPASGDED
jgi:hypothetical protein